MGYFYWLCVKNPNQVSLMSSSRPKHMQYGTIFKKKTCSAIKLFFFFKYVLFLTALSKIPEKKSGVTVLV